MANPTVDTKFVGTLEPAETGPVESDEVVVEDVLVEEVSIDGMCGVY